jgi:D-amino-acid dehydrogenase
MNCFLKVSRPQIWERNMKAVVIGSGLIGVTSAYFLARRGWQVTVIDRQEGPGRETSLANGALLTPSMPEPWNAPGSWRLLLMSLVRSDSALQLRLKELPALASWGARFLKNTSPARYKHNTLSNLNLALHSLDVMKRLRKENGLEYETSMRGSLRVFRNAVALESAAAEAEFLKGSGLSFNRLTDEQTVALEPALAPIGTQLAGGIHYPTDEVGDAYEFCLLLAEQARRLGVEFHFRTEVSEIEVRSGRATGALAGPKRFAADRYVISAGSYTPRLLARVGLKVPVQPAKGYSITFDRHPHTPRLRIPIIDDNFHAAVVPLESVIRIAGTAEFSGYDLSLPSARIANLLTLLGQILPQMRPDHGRAWCGLRPMSADGVPIIGPTPIENLWINTGHGHLGWTMAAGSAQLLSDLLFGESSTVNPDRYALQRFES